MTKKTTVFSGHRPLENARMREIRAFINQWLLSPTVYCNYCGRPYFPDEKACCERPEIGRNVDFCGVIIQQNKDTLAGNLNDLGATANLGMRMGLSMPVDLLKRLEDWHRTRFGFKLFENRKALHEFMRAFPMFKICERI